MSETDFLGLASHNIDLLDASDNTLILNAQRFINLGTVGLSRTRFRYAHSTLAPTSPL